MTMRSKNEDKKSPKDIKVARFVVDILAVYKSETNVQIPLTEAMKSLKERFSVKPPPKTERCLMQIWKRVGDTYYILLKAKEKNKVLEFFDINAIGTPSCSQMIIGKYQSQSLVFLPVLNKDNVAELFIFHPHQVTAQEVVIKIATILENSQKENEIQNRILNDQISTDRKGINNHDHDQLSHRENDDNKSLYSISSDFINIWYGKLDSIHTIQPNALSSLASVHEELHTINQYLKDIRFFMNRLFNVIHCAVKERKRKLHDTLHSKNEIDTQIVRLPSKDEFLEVIKKIKTCLNLSAAHKEIIINPSSEEIINQLFIFLKIIGDATINNKSGKPDLLCGVKSPQINSTTVKFLSSKLNIENLKYWMVLGYNFGYLKGSLPNQMNRTPIDEFQIKEISNVYEYDQKNYPLTLQQQFPPNRYTSVDSLHDNEPMEVYNTPMKSYRNNNNRSSPVPFVNNDLEFYNAPMKSYRNNNFRSSPVPLVNNDLIYRSYPRLFESERKAPLFHESETLQYQNLPSNSPHVNCYNRSNNSTWDDRQCRFIDAIQLRNGRIGKALYDKSGQNYKDLGVSSNEIVEILKDYGDVFSIKNALGEIGECPKSIITELHHNHSR